MFLFLFRTKKKYPCANSVFRSSSNAAAVKFVCFVGGYVTFTAALGPLGSVYLVFSSVI